MQPQTIARTTGILVLITYVTSIPALLMFASVLDPDYVMGPGVDGRIRIAAVLELMLILANIASAVVLYPIAKRQSPVLALGFVTARILESIFIAVGLVSVLAIVSLRQGAGADAAALVPVAQALASLKEWTFLLGPGFVVGLGNGLILGYLMYASGLMPRPFAVLGLVGGPILSLSGLAIMLGYFEAGSVWQYIATVPEFFWELAIGLYLTIYGFRASPILSNETNAPGETAKGATS